MKKIINLSAQVLLVIISLTTLAYSRIDGPPFNQNSVLGNLTFTGTGQKITGDFSNATLANRLMFQTSTTNGNTGIEIVPNGSATIASLALETEATATTSSTLFFQANSTAAIISSTIRGAGTYVPITILVAGAERVKLDTVGHIKYSGTIPVLSSCGTSPVITTGSSDMAGTVTMGTGSPTGCVITFATAYNTSAPTCKVTWRSNLASMGYTTSTTALTITQTATSSNVIDYECSALQ